MLYIYVIHLYAIKTPVSDEPLGQSMVTLIVIWCILAVLQIGWYNDCVTKPFKFSYDRDTLAFVLISTPSMFEKAFKPFLVSPHCVGVRDPIDQCMDYRFKCSVQVSITAKL